MSKSSEENYPNKYKIDGKIKCDENLLAKNYHLKLLKQIEELEKAKSELEQKTKALEESEVRYRSLFETETDAILIVDRKTKAIADANDAACALYGYSHEEFKSLSYLDITAEPEQSQAIIDGDEEQVHIPLRYHSKKDGTRFPVDIVGRIFEFNGKPHFFTAVHDITDREDYQKALIESERSYREIFNSTNEAIVIHDKDTYEIIDLNEAAIRMFGFEFKDEIMNDLQSFKSYQRGFSIDKEGLMNLEKTMHEGSQLLEWEAVKQNGDSFWVELSFKTSNINGRECIIVTIRDINERKRYEKELLISRDRLLRAEEVSRSGNWEYDLKTGIVSASEGARSILGWEGFIWKIQDLMQIPLPEYRPIFESAIHSLVSDNKPYDLHFKMNKPASDEIIIIHSVAYYDKNRDTIFGFMQDVTAQKTAEEERAKLQEQLIQSQKMESIGRLAGGVAHDFNNMLQLIIGHSDIALNQIETNSPVFENIQEIMKAAQRSADLTKQLLAFARKQTISPKILDLNEAVSDIQKMLNRLIGEDVDLIWKPGDNLWKVKMDPAQINQILANLVINARDAITGMGLINIMTANVTLDVDECMNKKQWIPGDYIQLSVADNGSGMSKEIMEKIFEPFFTTKEMGKGTGLGLATVYGIVQQNNGFIDVYSEPGLGTTFKIYFPRYWSNEVEIDKRQESVEAVRGGSEVVLLVEDEEAIMKLGKKSLEKQGYTVLTAGTPDAAVGVVAANPGKIRMVITDVIMPGMNGKELIDEIKKMEPSVKALYMSGYPAEVIVHRGMLDSDVNFIQKPFSMADMIRKVRNILDENG